jgi:hypothetical protein
LGLNPSPFYLNPFELKGFSLSKDYLVRFLHILGPLRLIVFSFEKFEGLVIFCS